MEALLGRDRKLRNEPDYLQVPRKGRVEGEGRDPTSGKGARLVPQTPGGFLTKYYFLFTHQTGQVPLRAFWGTLLLDVS